MFMYVPVWYIYLIYGVLNGLIRMSAGCSVDLIFILLAAELYYFELKNLYTANYFYSDSDKWFQFSKCDQD